jgi:hypothetical protein
MTIRIVRRLARIFLGPFIGARALTVDGFQVVASCRSGQV